jgi:oligoribonuclease
VDALRRGWLGLLLLLAALVLMPVLLIDYHRHMAVDTVVTATAAPQVPTDDGRAGTGPSPTAGGSSAAAGNPWGTATATPPNTTPIASPLPAIIGFAGVWEGASLHGFVKIRLNTVGRVGPVEYILIGTGFEYRQDATGPTNLFSPHSSGWDTTAVANGDYTLTAAPQNTQISSITVHFRVRNPPTSRGSRVRTVAGNDPARTPVRSAKPMPAAPEPAGKDTVERMDRLVWIDCEMTGLDAESDILLEVACLVTDSDLTVLGEGMDLVLAAPEDALDRMLPIVREMHQTSGLTAAVRTSTLTVDAAEAQLLDYVRGLVPEVRRAPLCGNSIATDRTFLARYMPALDRHLHYRMIDVSSIKELARRWYPRAYYAAPVKRGGHRALADIRESIEELRYYRQAIFTLQPGPSTEEARAIAETIRAGEAGGAGLAATAAANGGPANSQPTDGGGAASEPAAGSGAAPPPDGRRGEPGRTAPTNL